MIYDNRAMARLTHKPTGRTVEVRDRSLRKAQVAAIRWLRSLVMFERTTPPAKPKLIRTYDIDGPAGTFIKDAQGNRLVEGGDFYSVVDRGELDRLRK